MLTSVGQEEDQMKIGSGKLRSVRRKHSSVIGTLMVTNPSLHPKPSTAGGCVHVNKPTLRTYCVMTNADLGVVPGVDGGGRMDVNRRLMLTHNLDTYVGVIGPPRTNGKGL